MNIFVLNTGSSSVKASIFQYGESLDLKWQTQIDFKQTLGKANQSIRQSGFEELFKTLKSEKKDIRIDLVGHRIVHGGTLFKDAVEITENVKTDLEKLIPLAPLHQKINLEGIEYAKNWFPKAKQFAVFDTAYYANLPQEVSTYPITKEWQNLGIKKYGFHGISHHYAVNKAREILADRFPSQKLITCHLGGGSSITATNQGHCIDTTMGFTPLDGLMMESRPGSLDPGILLYLLKTAPPSAEELEETLYYKSGFMGICGFSDLRLIEKKVALGEQEASLAFRMYIHRLKGYIGYLIAAMNGIDALIFTGGIGEHSERVRLEVCNGLTTLGPLLDKESNCQKPLDQDIAAKNSKVRILVIRSREDEQIAQEIINRKSHGYHS